MFDHGAREGKRKNVKKNAMEAFWGQREPCEVKKCQRELYSARVSCQRGPKGAKREPHGSQKGAKEEPKGAKQSTKGDKREPKGAKGESNCYASVHKKNSKYIS